MAGVLKLKPRNIVPRWRLFATTAALGDLHSVGQRAPVEPSIVALERGIAQFNEEPSVWQATDLLSAALVLGRPSMANDAAFFVVKNERDVSPAAVALAHHVLDGPVAAPDETQSCDWHEAVRRSRMALKDYPRDAMRWADLGLAHTVLGNCAQAVRCLDIAVNLAPHNRFVLRAAARCFLHWGDPERAHAVLHETPFVSQDPWLLAAEMATASIRGRRSRLHKDAERLIRAHSIPARDLSELTTALGKLELEHGAGKKAVALLTRALIDPTENAVAQIEWEVNKQQNILTIRGELDNIDVPLLHEAKASDRYAAGDWAGAVYNADLWQQDQPFSSRPASVASYAAHLIGDYEYAVGSLKKVKSSNPNDVMLLNNLAYYQILADELPDARITFETLSQFRVEGTDMLVIRATAGLLEFRNHRPDIGRALYKQTIVEARTKEERHVTALALVNLAREEALIGNREDSNHLLASAREVIRRCDGQTVLNAELAAAERAIDFAMAVHT